MKTIYKIPVLLTAIWFLLLPSITLSNSNNSQNLKTNNNDTKHNKEFYDKIINEYKNYLTEVPQEVKEEIIKYRTEISKLNKQKKLLYKKLSQEAQNHLKKEQKYKAQIPINKKRVSY